MRYRFIYMLVPVGLIVLILVLPFLEQDRFHKRFHQHKEVSTKTKTELDFTNMSTHLPVIKIETGGKRIPGARIKEIKKDYQLSEDGKSEIETKVQVYDKNEKPLNLSAMVHYRGNSSRLFRKKSYALDFINKDKSANKVALLGMGADNNWALHGPYIDRSLVRNYLAMNVAGEIMPYSPEVRFAEVFVDDRYEGLYLLMEKNSKSKGRLDLTPPENNSEFTSYILAVDRRYRMENSLNDFLTYTFRSYPSGVEMIYPSESDYTKAREQFVVRDFSYIANSIYQIPFAQEEDHYREFIDVEAFYDYFIINELFRNVDAGHYSTYFYRDLKGKLTPAVWDFNNSLDNYQETKFDASGFSLTQAVFYEQLLKDKDFTDGLIRRYHELRETKLETAYLNRYIDDTVAFLGDAVGRNNERWKDMYDLGEHDTLNYLQRLKRNVRSYDEAIGQMKGYLDKRGKWLDKNIETLRQYSHSSRHSHESIR